MAGSQTTFIYVITANTRAVKVGIAKDPRRRLSELPTGCPDKLEVADTIKVNSRDLAYKIETEVHRRLAGFALEGEWFAVSPAQAVAMITTVISGRRPDNQIREVVAARRVM